MSNATSAARGAVWTSATGIVSQAISFAVFIVIARMLEPSDYGIVALCLAVILVLGAGAGLGLEKLLVQVEHAGRTETDTAFLLSLTLGLLSALLLWLTAPALARWLDNPELMPVLRALSPMVLLRALQVVPMGLLIRAFRFRAIALRSIFALAVGGAAGISMALQGYGVWALVTQELVRAGFGLAATWLACSWKPGTAASLKTGRRMLSLSLNIMGTEVTRIAQNHADRFLIGALLGVTSLGIYTVASKVQRVASIILLDSLGMVGLPTFSRARDSDRRLQRVYYQCQHVGATLTLPVFVLLILTADSVIPLLLGEKWHSSAPVLQILCLASCASCVGVFNSPLLLSVGRAEVVLRLSVLAALAGLVGVLIAVPWGILAVSLVYALLAWLVLPLELVYCRRFAGVRVGPVLGGFARQLLALAFMSAAVGGFELLAQEWPPWPQLLATLGLGVAVYATTIMLIDRPLASLLLSVPALMGSQERD